MRNVELFLKLVQISLQIAKGFRKQIGFEFFRSVSKERSFLFSLKAHHDRSLHEFRSEKKKIYF